MCRRCTFAGRSGIRGPVGTIPARWERRGSAGRGRGRGRSRGRAVGGRGRSAPRPGLGTVLARSPGGWRTRESTVSHLRLLPLRDRTGSGGARPEGKRRAPSRAFESGVKFAAETTSGADEEATEVTGKGATGALSSGHDGLTAKLGGAPELRFPEPGQVGGDPGVHHVRTLPSIRRQSLNILI